MLPSFRDIPIKRKVTLIIVMACTGVLVLVFLGLLVFELINARAIIERTLRVEAEIIAANCTAAMAFDDRNAAAEVLAALRAQPHVLCASLYQPDRRRFAHYGLKDDRDELPAGPIPVGLRVEGSQMVLFWPVLLEKRTIGMLYLSFDSRAIEKEMILPFLLILGCGMPVALLTAVGISSAFQGVLSGPILRLISTATAVAENKDYTVRAVCCGSDELGTLTKAFNQMLARIQEQDGALRDSEGRYRLLFQSNPLPMFVYDEETLAILAANGAAIRHYGSPLCELLRMTFGDLGASSPAAVESGRAARQEGPVAFSPPTRHRKRDGSLIDVDVTTHPIEFSGRRSRLALCHDITERKRIERERDQMEVQLRQAQKLQAIGHLAAGIAHEINTPVQFIGDNTRFVGEAFAGLDQLLGQCAQLLETGGGQPIPPELLAKAAALWRSADVDYLRAEVPGALRQTLEGVERISKIVRAMKDFSHPGTEGKSLVDLNRLVESTLTVCRNEWKYVADLVTDFDNSLTDVPCLPGEFNQVILNLVVNAAHAIGDVLGPGATSKGTLTVTTRRIEAWAEVRITDTGAGISESVRPHIFEPFFTTKDVGRGTGQGLAIAHSVVRDKHGGTIRFETEIGKGTTFVLRLPLVAPAISKTTAKSKFELIKAAVAG